MPKRPRRTEFGDTWDGSETAPQNHERWGNHWMAWTWWIFVLEGAARILGESAQYEAQAGQIVMPAVFSVRAMILGYAIEDGFKCYWIRKGNKMVQNGKFVGVAGTGSDHNLVQLAKGVGFKPTQRETDVLDRLSKFIRFAGRYPISKRPEEMMPRHIDGLGKLDVGFFSKADFRTCLSILNKLMTLISGKKRRNFQPLGTMDYINRAKQAALRKQPKGAS